MEAFLLRLSSPAIILPICLLTSYFVYNHLTTASKTPAGLPWVGKDPNKLFANTRATMASFSSIRQWLEIGYSQYGKNNLSYIIPDISGKPEVVLPRSQIAWLLEQPDNVLSTSAFHYDSLEGDYTFTDSQILEDPYHVRVMHKYLPRRIAPLIPDMWEEIQVALDRTWGMDTKT